MTSFRMRQSENNARYLRAFTKTSPSVDDPTEAFGMVGSGAPTVEPKPAPKVETCPVCGMPAYGGLQEYGEAMCYDCLEGMAE